MTGYKKEPGLRERRRSATGTTVSLWDATQADFETGGKTGGNRWVTMCEDHNEGCLHRTLREARERMPRCEWCTQCQNAAHRQSRSCASCGSEIVWFDEESTPRVWFDEESTPRDASTGYDAALVAECGCCASGVLIRDKVYCLQCMPAAVGRELQAPASPLIEALFQSVLDGTGIEVLDFTGNPPEPGTLAQTLYEGAHRASRRAALRGRN